jgi:heme-degrading monooxygenase HmoA
MGERDASDKKTIPKITCTLQVKITNTLSMISSRLLALTLALLCLFCSSACQLASPFRFASNAPDHEGPVFVGVTNARVDGRNRRTFDEHTRRVVNSLPNQPGFLGYSLRTRLLGNEVWTVTVWEDEAALEKFVRSPVHRQAMREGTPQVLTARFLRFPWPSLSPPPSWATILERLKSADTIDYAQLRAEKRSSAP